MDKTAQLKSISRRLIGEGFLAHEKIQSNRNSARSTKGWDTRRKKNMTKKADRENVSEFRSAVRTFGVSLESPKKAIKIHAMKNLMNKVKKLVYPGGNYGNQTFSK